MALVKSNWRVRLRWQPRSPAETRHGQAELLCLGREKCNSSRLQASRSPCEKGQQGVHLVVKEALEATVLTTPVSAFPRPVVLGTGSKEAPCGSCAGQGWAHVFLD